MLKLQAVELSKSYQGRKVVDDLDMEISQGEVVGLLGPNGAGKTTTFYILVGLARPDSGRVLLNGDDITDLPMYLRARSGISYLPQEPSVFRQLTVEENLIAVLETLPLTAEQRRDRLEELLAQMKLETVRLNGAYTLSGGERRRLEIARSLVLEPAFILLDEPFSGIDPLTLEFLPSCCDPLNPLSGCYKKPPVVPAWCKPPGVVTQLSTGGVICMYDPPIPSPVPDYVKLIAAPIGGTWAREQVIRHREGRAIAKAQLDFATSFLALNPTLRGGVPLYGNGSPFRCACETEVIDEVIGA